MAKKELLRKPNMDNKIKRFATVFANSSCSQRAFVKRDLTVTLRKLRADPRHSYKETCVSG